MLVDDELSRTFNVEVHGLRAPRWSMDGQISIDRDDDRHPNTDGVADLIFAVRLDILHRVVVVILSTRWWGKRRS